MSEIDQPLAAIVSKLEELRWKLSKILDDLIGYRTIGVPTSLLKQLKEPINLICEAIDTAIQAVQARVEAHNTVVNVPGIARSLKLMTDYVKSRAELGVFSVVLDLDGLRVLGKCMDDLKNISVKIGGDFPEKEQVPALEALAFAEALLEKIKGSPLLLGSKLVSYEAGQMNGERITIATDQSCYIEALLLFYISFHAHIGDSFKETLIVAAPEDPSLVLKYTIGNLSFKEILEQTKIPVIEVSDGSQIKQAMCESLGLVVVRDDALNAAIDSIPRYLQLEQNFVALLRHLEVSTFPSLWEVYGLSPAVHGMIELMEDLTQRRDVLSRFREIIGDEKATKLLIKALKDKDKSVREAAAWALGEIRALERSIH